MSEVIGFVDSVYIPIKFKWRRCRTLLLQGRIFRKCDGGLQLIHDLHKPDSELAK